MRWAAVLLILLVPVAVAGPTQSDPAGDQAWTLSSGLGPGTGDPCIDASTDILGAEVFFAGGHVHMTMDVVDINAQLRCAENEVPPGSRHVEQIISRMWQFEGGPGFVFRPYADAGPDGSWTLCVALRIDFVWYEGDCFGTNALEGSRFHWSVPLSGTIGWKSYSVPSGGYDAFGSARTTVVGGVGDAPTLPNGVNLRAGHLFLSDQLDSYVFRL